MVLSKEQALFVSYGNDFADHLCGIQKNHLRNSPCGFTGIYFFSSCDDAKKNTLNELPPPTAKFEIHAETFRRLYVSLRTLKGGDICMGTKMPRI